MPAMITHLLCADYVLKKLKPDVQEIIKAHKNVYNIGSQGPDVFFYRPKGATRNVGSMVHGQAVGEFLAQMAHCVKDGAELQFAYFAGYLVHYALDCAAHPYIYYKTGFDASGNLTGKYTAYHLTFEAAIDTQLLKYLQNSRPIDDAWWQKIKQNNEEMLEIGQMVAHATNVAHGTKLKPNDVKKAMTRYQLAARLLRSRFGVWRGVVQFAENIFTNGAFHATIHKQEICKTYDYLNRAKSPWKQPLDSEIRTDNFKEMFDTATADATKMITALHHAKSGEISQIDLMEVLGDRSFNSGVSLKTPVQFKVHDIIYKN